ncbi:MAG: hypothetical protein QOH21_2192 [Acidobacteriota bacterium]|jgi:hypothetical protein|nr:hypothetical protein [Acidobacteriota bacterium]
MRKFLLLVVVLGAASARAATPPLFPGATESKWKVTKGTAAAGSVTLLTSASGVRAEWRADAKAPVTIFLGGQGKVWVRETGGDAELSAHKGGIEMSIVPALVFTDAKATYKKDEKGVVEVQTGGYTLTRTSLSTSKADASNFAIRPKKSASSRLASMGGLLGSSQSNVSATAGGRGAGTKGLKLADGGDYAAVEAVENRDAKWTNLQDVLAKFQKEGKIGKERENQ